MINDDIMFSLVLLSCVWILYKGLHFIFLFQSKGYRINRVQAHIHDRGFLTLFYTFKIQIPSKTLRNILLASFHAIVTGIIFLYAFENVYVYNFLSNFFFLAPFVAFVIVLSGAVLTSIPVYLYRWIIIQLARWKIRKTKTKFIGISGSFGKSSVKEYLYVILSQKFRVAKTEDERTTDIGIALSILKNISPDIEYFIIEAESFGKGEMQSALNYIPFTYCILTGLGNTHLDLYGNKKYLIEEQIYLFRKLIETGKAYINQDAYDTDEPTFKILPSYTTYGLSRKSEIYPNDFKTNHTYTTARIHYQRTSFHIQTTLLGKHSLQNLLPAIALSYDIGIHPTKIQQAINSIRHTKGRLSIHRGPAKSVIILDLINANVDGFIAAADIIKYFPQKTKIAVSCGIEELGVEKRDSYERIVHKLINNGIQLYTTDLLFRKIKKSPAVITFNDVSSLQKELLLKLEKGTVVLIEGEYPPSYIQELIKHK